MRLTYWVAQIKGDSHCYSFRRRTKRAIVNDLASEWAHAPDYDKPRKVTVDYTDGFDLMVKCLQEGGADWEDNWNLSPLEQAEIAATNADA